MRTVNVNAIGEYIRQQREQAKISLRQLAEAAGVSNPYLSQIERGLRRPSAEILQQKVAPTWQCNFVGLSFLTDSFEVGSHQERGRIVCVSSEHANNAVAPLFGAVAATQSGRSRRSSRSKDIREPCGGAFKR